MRVTKFDLAGRSLELERIRFGRTPDEAKLKTVAPQVKHQLRKYVEFVQLAIVQTRQERSVHLASAL